MSVAATKVREVLAKHILTDGYEPIIDLENVSTNSAKDSLYISERVVLLCEASFFDFLKP